MPLPFDLASLITNYTAPASSAVNPMVLERMQLEQNKKNDAFDQERQRFYMNQSQDDRDYNRDSDAWDKIREAIYSGEPELIQLAQAEAARRGFALEYNQKASSGGAAQTVQESAEVSRATQGLKPGTGQKVYQGDGFEFTYPDEAAEKSQADAQTAKELEQAEKDGLIDTTPYPGQKRAPKAEAPPVPSMAAEISGVMGLPTQQTQQSSGGLTVRDRSGKVLFQADQGQIIAARQQRVGEVFDRYIEQAGDEEEKAAANLAKGVAQKALAAGYSMKEAVALGIQEYNKNVDPLRKAFIGTEVAKARGKYRYGDGSGGGGGGGAPGNEITAGQSRLSDDELKIVKQAQEDSGLKQGVHDAMGQIDLALQAAQSNEGMSQMSAVRGFIASISGKVVTNAEARDYFQSTGLLNDLERLAQRTFGQGELPQELLRQLQTVLLRAKRGYLMRKKEAARRGAQYARRKYGDESARAVAEWIGFPLESLGLGAGGSGGGGAAPAKAAPGKRKSPEELAK